MFDNIWTEKYRAHFLKDLLISDDLRKTFEEYKTKEEIPPLLFIGGPGTGKAQPLYSKIKIPGGWTTMGQIKVGDVVSTPDGKTAKVTHLFPQGQKEVVEITFKDGRSVECCRDHLWNIKCSGHYDKWQTLSTSDIMKKLQVKSARICIPLTKCEEKDDIELPIDPYVLGYWLGDGTSCNSNFTVGKEDIGDYLNNSPYIKFHIQKDIASNYTIQPKINEQERDSTLLPKLKLLNIHNNKHIPNLYLNSSYKQKIALIQGLLDSDGYVSKQSHITFSNSNRDIILGMQELIHSIGGIAKIKSYQPQYKYHGLPKKCKLSYSVSIRYKTPEELFRLKRKKDRCSLNYQYKDLKLGIHKITSLNRFEECQCILLDSPEHLYITNNYIVTHNTSLAKILVNDILQCQYLYINASDESGVDTIRNKVSNFAQTKSIDGKVKVIILDEADGISGEGQRALRNTMEEYSSITRFILTGNYKHKVIEPIQSRCQEFDIAPSLKQCLTRCLEILKKENIQIASDQLPKLSDLVRSNYPDLRKCINEVQKFSVNGILNIHDCNIITIIEQLYKMIKSRDIKSIRKFLIESEQSFSNDYPNVLRGLFNYFDKNETDELTKKYALLVLAEHLYKSAFVVDQEINAYACLITLCEKV